MERQKLQNRLGFTIILITLLNYLAMKFFWYLSIWWFDIFMHFLGGFWLGLGFFYIFKRWEVKKGDFLRVLFFALAIGGGWEVFEYVVNNLYAGRPFDQTDTIMDLVMDSLGALCSLWYVKMRIFSKN